MKKPLILIPAPCLSENHLFAYRNRKNRRKTGVARVLEKGEETVREEPNMTTTIGLTTSLVTGISKNNYILLAFNLFR